MARRADHLVEDRLGVRLRRTNASSEATRAARISSTDFASPSAVSRRTMRSSQSLADDLDEQPLLRAEVVVQQAARDAGLLRDHVERRAGGAATRRRWRASRLRCAWPSRPRAAGVSRPPPWCAELSWPASRDAGLAQAPGTTKAPRRAPSNSRMDRAALGSADRLRCCSGAVRRRRGGGRGVLELLLGTEQTVEHLLAQALAEDRARRRRRRCPAAVRGRCGACASSACAESRRRLERLGGFLELALQASCPPAPSADPCR